MAALWTLLQLSSSNDERVKNRIIAEGLLSNALPFITHADNEVIGLVVGIVANISSTKSGQPINVKETFQALLPLAENDKLDATIKIGVAQALCNMASNSKNEMNAIGVKQKIQPLIARNKENSEATELFTQIVEKLSATGN